MNVGIVHYLILYFHVSMHDFFTRCFQKCPIVHRDLNTDPGEIILKEGADVSTRIGHDVIVQGVALQINW